MYALVRYHFKVDPDTISQQQLIEMFAELKWVKQKQAESSDNDGDGITESITNKFG